MAQLFPMGLPAAVLILVPSRLFSGLSLVLLLLNSLFSQTSTKVLPCEPSLSCEPSLLRFLFPRQQAPFFLTLDPCPNPPSKTFASWGVTSKAKENLILIMGKRVSCHV